MTDSITLLGSFIEGIVSFFSPCIVPLLPVYLGYISGTSIDNKQRNRFQTLINTLFFVLGISMAFILMALAITKIGQIINKYHAVIQIISGILIIILALSQFGIIKFVSLERSASFTDKAIKINHDLVRAFLMGFLFSFSWTPCVGPILTSIVLLSTTSIMGYLYILVYLLGFVIPFIILGLFTNEMLELLKKHRNLLPVISKIGATVLLIMGFYSLSKGVIASNNQNTTISQNDANNQQQEEIISMANYDFVLTNVEGKEIKLSDFKGKPIVLNYFATWCGYCQQEIEALKTIQKDNPDIAVVGVLEIGNESEQDIKDYLKEKDFNYPILLDYNNRIGLSYGINGYPTTMFINKNFNLFGYVPGYLDSNQLKMAINDTVSDNR